MTKPFNYFDPNCNEAIRFRQFWRKNPQADLAAAASAIGITVAQATLFRKKMQLPAHEPGSKLKQEDPIK